MSEAIYQHLRKAMFDPSLCKKLPFHTLRIPKKYRIYTSGDEDQRIYFIERGHVKLVFTSLEGKECLLNIYSEGDFFGESCLVGLGGRMEAAIAMERAVLRSIPSHLLLTRLSDDQLRGLVHYLANRIVEQQMFIAEMTTLSSKSRLGNTLLRLAQKMGEPHPSGTIIRYRISQEELSQIVGTTRPRISEFMHKFRELRLVNLSPERFIILNEKKLDHYLSTIGTSSPFSFI